MQVGARERRRMAPFKPNDLLAVLDEYDVRYVLIGGLAATAAFLIARAIS